MTIQEGSVIQASDLNDVWTDALALIQEDNDEVPGVYWHQWRFQNLTSGTASHRRTGTLILPDDSLIENVAVTAGEMSGTLRVVISGANLLETITVTGSVSAGFSKLSRYTGPRQVLLRGSEITVTVSTTDSSGVQVAQVGLGLRSVRRRY